MTNQPTEENNPVALEEHIPSVSDYKTEWSKKTKGSSTHIKLKFELKPPFRSYDFLMDLLRQEKIPLHNCFPLGENGYFYSGHQADMGTYSIGSVIKDSSYNSYRRERVTVKIDKETEGIGRISDFLSVISKYVKRYEEAKKEKERKKAE